MQFNILRDALFPVVTRSGGKRWASFAELAIIEGDDSPVAFDWPRPDLNIASFELAIGLSLLLFQPQSDAGWRDLWNDPPTSDDVAVEAGRYLHAFNLVGDGPLFMQDFEAFSGEETPVEALLIDTPGANGQKKNADVLTWRGRYPAMGLPAAAIALYALQQFAPAGGAGNRTSMRGGGPLTTLVSLSDATGDPAPLWRTIIANLPLLRDELPVSAQPRALPWLAPTLVSDSGRKLTPADPAVNDLQAFFGQPRRIRLVTVGHGDCSLTGVHGPMVAGYVQKAYGANYDLWMHPLTPYRRQKEGSEPYSVKPKSGYFGYREWISVVYDVSSAAGLAETSRVLKLSEDRAKFFDAAGLKASLIVGGWAMNNMEAIAFLHAVKPLYLSDVQHSASDMMGLAVALAEVGETSHQALRMALRKAHFADGATVSTDSGMFEQVRTDFYARTERAFHEILHSAYSKSQVDRVSAGKVWLDQLRDEALALFSDQTQDVVVDPAKGERTVEAWRGLQAHFSGYGKLGAAMYGRLGLSPPAKRKAVGA